PEPLVDLRVFHDRQFSGAIFITVAAFFAYSGFVYFTALYLQQVRGLSPLEAGIVMLPGALPVLAGGPPSRPLGRPRATPGARCAAPAACASPARSSSPSAPCCWRCRSLTHRCGRSSSRRSWSASATGSSTRR